jgi:hypothetical protein
MDKMIELTLRVMTRDEGQAAKVAEMLARTALGISAEDGCQVSTDIERFSMSCEHDHEVGP